MWQQILEILEEQGNCDQLLVDMANAQTDEEILNIAHKIIAKRNEYEWLKIKLATIFERDTAG